MTTNNITTAVPSNVYAVDLVKLSQLVGCSEDELVRGMHSSVEAVDTEGVRVDNDEKVPFQAIEGPDVTTPNAVKQVLLTAASRPSPLDMFGLPKCLITLGRRTIIEHILSQLYSAGIERIVVTVSHCGQQIIDAVKTHPMYHKMEIEFVDLGEENRDCHARSILAAKDKFTEPFLLHTVDHIFDGSLVSDMASYTLEESSAACVLVERNISNFQKNTMPSTTVKVTLEEDSKFIRKIARQLSTCDAIDAGLFLCTTRIFDALEKAATEKPYFSLAEALDLFTPTHQLMYLETRKKTWFSIETQEQLDFAKDHKGDPVLSPWSVYVARPPPVTPVVPSSAPAASAPIHSILFGVPAPETDTTLHVLAADKIQQSKVFSGFVVGVGHVESMEPSAFDIEEQLPLLKHRRSTLREPTKRLESIDDEDPFVVSIPMQTEVKGSAEDAHEAFLIEMPPDTTKNNVFLAVAEMPAESPKFTLLQRALTLPGDVTNVKLETVGPDFSVQVVVDRQVPAIGFILLVTALFTISSIGAALDLQLVDPPLKLFWRMSATCIAFIPWMLFSLRRSGIPEFSKNDLQSMALCSIAYALFTLSFVISLDLTTVGDAYIFNNAHSLLIVFGKIFTGVPVLLLEGAGALIGLGGGIVCTFDHSGSTKNASNPVAGDLIALAGAVCGVGYLTIAKKLRSKMDLFVFMTFLTGIGSCAIFLYLLTTTTITMDRHPIHGIFGWLNTEPTRLPLELYMVYVCNFMGTMGYIAVMKYFDPIVVSVVMLLEPILASALGVALGVDSLPGAFTYLGGSAVLLGTLMVILSARQSTESIDVTDAVRSRRNTNYGTAT